MVKKHLGVKTKPFSTEEWGSVVVEGAKISTKITGSQQLQ